MTTRSTIAMALSILACGTATAADRPDLKMDKPAGGTTAKLQTHHAVGVVRAVDAAKGTITLSHGPVPSIQWPAMTMPFTASKEQLASVKAGVQVKFEFVANGMNASITSISKAK